MLFLSLFIVYCAISLANEDPRFLLQNVNYSTLYLAFLFLKTLDLIKVPMGLSLKLHFS